MQKTISAPSDAAGANPVRQNEVSIRRNGGGAENGAFALESDGQTLLLDSIRLYTVDGVEGEGHVDRPVNGITDMGGVNGGPTVMCMNGGPAPLRVARGITSGTTWQLMDEGEPGHESMSGAQTGH